jgi:ADP-heptose:LPS heptosyltransferase
MNELNLKGVTMVPEGSVIPDVRKIAVLRANALGDFICALPALEALRATYPRAEIVLLAKSWHQAFLRGRPGPVDRVIVIPPCAGVGMPETYQNDEEALERFFQEMARERFDLAFQIHGGGKYSNPFLLRLGARITIGLKAEDAPPLDRWLPYIFFQQEVLRYLEVASLAGAKMTVLEPRLTVTPADLAEAQRVLPEERRPLAVLHPGSGDPARRWAPERFAAVGDALYEAGARVVVTGTGSERPVVEQVIHAMRHEGYNLCDRLSIGGLAGLLTRSRVVISNDSGPLHLARAVGAATVGIYWCFNMMNYGPLSRLHHRPFVSWLLICPVCGVDRSQKSCDHHASFVNTIAQEDVVAAALDLFSKSLPSRDEAIVEKLVTNRK